MVDESGFFWIHTNSGPYYYPGEKPNHQYLLGGGAFFIVITITCSLAISLPLVAFHSSAWLRTWAAIDVFMTLLWTTVVAAEIGYEGRNAATIVSNSHAQACPTCGLKRVLWAICFISAIAWATTGIVEVQQVRKMRRDKS